MKQICLIFLIVSTLVSVPFVAGQQLSDPNKAAQEIEQALKLTRDERRQIQIALAAVGFSPGTMNGLFGLQTRGAILSWQRSLGQPETGYLNADAAIALLDSTATPEQERTDQQLKTPAFGTDTEFISPTSGLYHTCGLRSDGTASCWGLNNVGHTSPPHEQFVSIGGGFAHTCGLKADGTAVCWGLNSRGQTIPPNEQFVSITGSAYHTCGLKSDGTAVCWGGNIEGQASPPEDEQFVSISSGIYHTCGLKSDGTAVCWGNDKEGQATPPVGEQFTSISSPVSFIPAA